MYSTYKIEDGPMFTFNGVMLTVEQNRLNETVVNREELEQLVEWLRMNLEKMNRDKWDAEHTKSCACDCVRPA